MGQIWDLNLFKITPTFTQKLWKLQELKLYSKTRSTTLLFDPPQNLLRFWITHKGVNPGFWILRFSEEFQIKTCCYINWWLFSDHPIIQGHHWVKHHMSDQMPLLVDQVDFWKSFNNSPNLNSNLNRKLATSFGFQIQTQTWSFILWVRLELIPYTWY
jgi:hypothetical protein